MLAGQVGFGVVPLPASLLAFLVLSSPSLFLPCGCLQLFRGPQPAGQPTCVAKYLGIAAVGTASGTTFVLLPGAPAPAGAKQPGAQQPPRCG